MKPVLSTAMVLLIGLASCSTTPQAIQSPAAVPARFSGSGQEVLPERWWLCFADAELDRLVQRALAENLSLRTVWARLAQAEALTRRAGASRWPSLDGEASGATTRVRGNEATAFALGAVASYELDLWGRVRSVQAAAALDARASAADVQAAAITLSAQVASTWYSLVEQRGQVALLGEQLRTNEEVLELVTLRFRRGQVGAADVLRQRQLVEARRGELATAQARVAVLANQLAVLLGQAPTQAVAPVAGELVALPPLPATGLPSELVQRRPDLQAAFYDVLAADRRVAAAVADRWPRISLVAQAETSAEKWRDLFDNWLALLAANVVAPIFDAGERSAEVARTRAVVSQQLNSYGQSILEALAEVENALVQEQKQQEIIASLARQVTLAAQVLERTRDNYTGGAVDYLRVLDALATHQIKQRELLMARRQLLEYRINLCRALGGGWEQTAPPLAKVQVAKE